MRQRLLGGVFAATLGLGVLPATASPSTSHSASPAYAVGWGVCPAAAPARAASQVQCGTLSVPLDWSDPSGEHVTVAVARRPAADPSRRVGTVFYNPGGPGDPAVPYIVNAERYFSADLMARFDLVALDPRTLGGSVQVNCGAAAFTPELRVFPRTRAQYDHLVRVNRTFSEACLRNAGPIVRHVDTITLARDHDALRIALGERQVNWLGISYGTQVGAIYAELFPSHTRAMVLDAALEHSGSETGMLAEEISTVEKSFNRFARWCRTAPTCALRGRDVGRFYDRLVARADRHPIPVPGAIHAVRGEDIRMETPSHLTFREPSIYGPDISWAGLSRILKAASEGDASAFALPAVVGTPLVTPPNLLIGCSDYTSPFGTWDRMQQLTVMARQLAPHLQGATELWQLARCAGWAVPPANPLRRLDVRGVPTLVVNATGDPSTSYKWAFGLSSQIQGSDVLTRTGDGHTSYYTSACARARTDRYLVTPGSPPAPICRS